MARRELRHGSVECLHALDVRYGPVVADESPDGIDIIALARRPEARGSGRVQRGADLVQVLLRQPGRPHEWIAEPGHAVRRALCDEDLGKAGDADGQAAEANDPNDPPPFRPSANRRSSRSQAQGWQ
jgi:hypothetical protein